MLKEFSNFKEVNIFLRGMFPLVAFALIIYALVSYFTGNVVSGWASSLIATCFLGGIQLISLGVIGEYVKNLHGNQSPPPVHHLGADGGREMKNTPADIMIRGGFL